jgi:hypothetical protein
MFKNRGQPQPACSRRAGRSGNRRGVWLLFVLIVIIALTFPKNRYSEYNYKVNDIAKETIIAPFDFPILKSKEELEYERREALKKIPFVFTQNKEIQEEELTALKEFFNEIDKIRQAKEKYLNSKKLLEQYRYSKKYEEVVSVVKTDSIAYTNLIKQFQDRFDIDTKSATFEMLISASPNSKSAVLLSSNLYPKIERILRDIFAQLVIDISKDEIISEKIAIKEDSEELLENINQVLTLEEAWTSSKLMLQNEFPEHGSEVINVGYNIIVHFLKPNLIFQKEITESRQKEAVDKVPLSRGVVLENEKIVDAHTRVTPEIYRKIDSLSKERARRTNIRGGLRKSLPVIGDPVMFLGQVALVGIIFSFFAAFLLVYKPEILRSTQMIVLIGILFILQPILAYIFVNELNISEYLVPITISAMALTILFDSRIAFAGAATISILVCAQLGRGVSFVVVSIFASLFAIYSVRQLRKRSQVFQSIIFILLGYLVGIVITESLRFSNLSNILDHFLYGGINGIISPFLTYGIIGLFESAFGITTDLSLLELADFNHPLLKLLSREATGTFTHSVTVGNLSEAAADAIGANALLARVGSYYHDVGKIPKPEYFVENQMLDYNKHDKLAPNLSALIVINHVKEGIRLAKEYNLPKSIIDFISTHHGTTRVEYFYQKALEQAEDPLEVNDADFRYPGPKPMTKETVIVMICESVEAAARSLKNPTLSNIEKTIDQIIENRLREDQFDESPVTFADLRKIKGDIKGNYGILPILKSIHHLRVEYPGQEEKKSSKNT